MTYDMGKDGEERFRNQEKQGKRKWCIAIHHLWLAEETSGCFFMGRSRISPPYHTSLAAKIRSDEGLTLETSAF